MIILNKFYIITIFFVEIKKKIMIFKLSFFDIWSNHFLHLIIFLNDYSITRKENMSER